MKRHGQVLGIEDKPESRRELTVSTPDYGRTRITLMAGVLGTAEGFEVVDRASNLPESALLEVRRSARDARRR